MNYWILPSKTLNAKTEELAKKQNKDHLTIMAFSHASGKHKLPLLTIGKSENPRALKNISHGSLLVIYCPPPQKKNMDGQYTF